MLRTPISFNSVRMSSGQCVTDRGSGPRLPARARVSGTFAPCRRTSHNAPRYVGAAHRWEDRRRAAISAVNLRSTAARLPNSLRLPRTSRSRVSGRSRQTSGVIRPHQAANDSSACGACESARRMAIHNCSSRLAAVSGGAGFSGSPGRCVNGWSMKPHRQVGLSNAIVAGRLPRHLMISTRTRAAAE